MITNLVGTFLLTESSIFKYAHKPFWTFMKTSCYIITKHFPYFWTFFLLTNVADFSNRKSSDFPKIVQPFSQKKSYAHKMKNS